MKLDCPGLTRERMASGAYRWRVRVKGRKSWKITLPIEPTHPEFLAHYHAARRGEKLETPAPFVEPKAMRGSVAWLVDAYQDAMPGLNLDPTTIKQRGYFLAQLRKEYGDYSMVMGSADVLKMRDARASTPGAADNFVKTVRAMYAWGKSRGFVKENPAVDVGKINRDGTGATPWTPADLLKFRDKHPQGTMAHLALTLFMFTACRRSEIIHLGAANEVQRDGVLWLDWQPSKAGAKRVRVPVLPPLKRALDAQVVRGLSTYLVTDYGRPFASPDAFANRFRKWCVAADLADRSAHGIRKAAGELLAEAGATEYQIMSVHGHSSPATSKVYTQGAERATLAGQAMKLLAGMDW